MRSAEAALVRHQTEQHKKKHSKTQQKQIRTTTDDSCWRSQMCKKQIKAKQCVSIKARAPAAAACLMAALLSLLNFAGAPQPGDLRIAVNSPDRSNRSQLFTLVQRQRRYVWGQRRHFSCLSVIPDAVVVPEDLLEVCIQAAALFSAPLILR